MLSAYGARLLRWLYAKTRFGPANSYRVVVERRRHRPVAVARSPLDTYLPRPSSSVAIPWNSARCRQEPTLRAMVSVKGYPAATGPGLLNAFLRMPHELI